MFAYKFQFRAFSIFDICRRRRHTIHSVYFVTAWLWMSAMPVSMASPFLPLLLLRAVHCLPFGSDSTLLLFFSSFYYIIMYSSVIVFGIFFFLLYRRYFFPLLYMPALLFLLRAPVFTIGLHNLLPSCLLIIMCKLNIAYRIIGEVSRSPRFHSHQSTHTHSCPIFVAAIVFSHIVLLLPATFHSIMFVPDRIAAEYFAAYACLRQNYSKQLYAPDFGSIYLFPFSLFLFLYLASVCGYNDFHVFSNGVNTCSLIASAVHTT